MTQSNAAPEIDLNGEKMRDFGNNTPFIPYGKGKYKAHLTGLLFHKGHKGRAYRAKFKILESDRADVGKGYDYATQFKFTEDQVKQEITFKSLRQLCAAAFKADASDKDFDGNAALKTLIDATTEDEIKGLDMHVEIVAIEKQATDKKTKELLLNKDGTPKMFTNLYFNRVEEAA